MATTHITPTTTPTGEARVNVTVHMPLCGHTESITELYDVSSALDWTNMVLGIHGKYGRCCN